MKKLLNVVALFALPLAPLLAGAQETYPAKPVRIVVGFPPGSSADVTARILAQKLAGTLGQQVLVDNRPGAGSNIAAEAVVRSPADGYTLLMGTVANTINASMAKNLTFNFSKDLAPIALVTTVPNILVVHPSLKVATVQELIVLAKSKPEQIPYASSGNATSPHLSGELFNQMAGVKLIHIPYKGSSQAITDLLAGRTPVMFSPASTVLVHIQSASVKALAITTTKRASFLPALPTVAESGLPGFDTSVWCGLVAPAGTPPAIIDKLATATNQALAAADLKTQLAAQGIEPLGGTPGALEHYIQTETEKWAALAKATGAKIE